MTVTELLQCAKPLVFENQDAEFTYSLHGTGFLARYRARYFGITAQHCLRTRTKESVRFELEPGGREFLPLNAVHVLEETNPNDWDYSDLAFFEIEKSLVDEHHLASHHFLDVDYFIFLDVVFNPTATLALRGFPSEINFVDYERQVIHTQAYAVDGKFAGLAPAKHCSFIQFTELPHITSLDGLSGSPVFQFEKMPNGLGYVFAGVLIRGNHNALRGVFIHSSVVFRALRLLCGG